MINALYGLESKIKYEFSALLWKYSAEGGWYFISLPKDISLEIRSNLKWQEEGWGRMKASAVIKDLHWNTSIWFDTKKDGYILPIKSEIRNNLSLKEGDKLNISVLI